MIVLNDTLGAFGGSHTMFVRMCEWYINNKISVCFFCDSRANVEISSKLDKIGVPIYVIDTKNFSKTYELIKKVDDGNLRFINFWWDRYLNIEAIKYKYKLSFENVIYCIHPKTFIKGEKFKESSIVAKIIKSKYNSMLPKLCQNNSIIMQDEIDISVTEEYYQTKLLPVPNIIRLPMTIEYVNKNSVIEQGYKNKILMTAARADFPFKGYVIGLVDDFVELKKRFPDLKLMICCDGEDIKILDEKISNIPEKYQNSVQCLRWMTYEELKKKMEECMIYIGMGSSVLDSSLRYKPSIVSRFYTMKNCAKDFTVDNPYDIEAKSSVDSPAIDLIEKVLNMSFEQYKDLSEKSYAVIRDIYGTDVIMSLLMAHKTKSITSVLNRSEYVTICMNNFVNKIRYRNKIDKASVKNLSSHK